MVVVRRQQIGFSRVVLSDDACHTLTKAYVKVLKVAKVPDVNAGHLHHVDREERRID